MIDADKENKAPGTIDVPSESQSATTPDSIDVPTNGTSVEDQAAIDARQRQSEMADAQLKQIEDEQKRFPLVGDKIPFEVLIMGYNEQDSPVFFNKAKELGESYSSIRLIRGDGNCFYRCLLIAQFELMLNDPTELARFDELANGWKQRLINLDYPEFTTEDFYDYFYTSIAEVKNKTKTAKEVFKALNDDNHCNYLIIFLRLITAGYLRENAGDYEPFIDNFDGLAGYCREEIEPMWKDADHLAITGLVKALGQPIRIEYMDRNQAPDGGWRYDFPADPVEEPKVTLLYRPGHYDLIYKN